MKRAGNSEPKWPAFSPSLHAHDLRLAESETGDRLNNVPSPDERKKSGATGRRRENKPSTILSMSTTTATALSASAASASASRPPDSLDLAITFLKKRDGIDKVLKIARYAAKFLLAANQSSSSSSRKAAVLAASLSPSYPPRLPLGSSFSSPTPPPPATLALLRLDQEPLRKLKAFESAVGDARKAYRMGKFLQGVDAFRRAAPAAARLSPAGVLACVAAAGDGCYYFLDQLTFFMRAGVIHKRYSSRLARAAAVCELIGYFGSSSLHVAAIAACAQREAELAGMLRGARKLDLLTDCRGEDEDEGDDGEERRERAKRELGGGEGETGGGKRRRRRRRSSASSRRSRRCAGRGRGVWRRTRATPCSPCRT